jgi:hypothetical protein
MAYKLPVLSVSIEKIAVPTYMIPLATLGTPATPSSVMKTMLSRYFSLLRMFLAKTGGW